MITFLFQLCVELYHECSHHVEHQFNYSLFNDISSVLINSTLPTNCGNQLISLEIVWDDYRAWLNKMLPILGTRHFTWWHEIICFGNYLFNCLVSLFKFLAYIHILGSFSSTRFSYAYSKGHLVLVASLHIPFFSLLSIYSFYPSFFLLIFYCVSPFLGNGLLSPGI